MNTKGDQSAQPEWLDSSGQGDLFDSFTDREVGLILLSNMDYEAQLLAVHALLRRQKGAEQDEIVEIEAFAKRTSGLRNQRAVDEWVDHLHASVYQKAAHSMAAVGMLAPLFESILCQSFSGIRRSFETNSIPFSSHPRWKLITKEQWDCHYVFTQSGGKKKNLVKGVLQLADATGLTAHLPNDLRPTLQALFEYRNKMFHFGFEWPTVERERFQMQTADWPSDWFATATEDHKPRIFYLTDTFINHCLTIIDSVLGGVGVFTRDKWPTQEIS